MRGGRAIKPAVRRIALERMEVLVSSATRNARSDPKLAEQHARLARRISTRHKVRMPYHLKMAFCKKCKSFIAPGVNSRIRLGREPVKAVRITCLLCGHTNRKLIR